MNSFESVEGLSECIDRAIREHIAKSVVAWPMGNLSHPILRFEAFLEDGSSLEDHNIQPKRIASVSDRLSQYPYPSAMELATTNHIIPQALGVLGQICQHVLLRHSAMLRHSCRGVCLNASNALLQRPVFP